MVGLRDHCRGNILRASCQRQQLSPGLSILGYRLSGPVGNRPTARVGFQASVVWAVAFAAASNNSRVTQFAGCSCIAFHEPAALDDTSSYAGTHKQGHHIGRSAARPMPELAPCRSLDIIDHNGRKPEASSQLRTKRYVVPFQIGSETHCTSSGVYLAGNTNADASD